MGKRGLVGHLARKNDTAPDVDPSPIVPDEVLSTEVARAETKTLETNISHDSKTSESIPGRKKG
jgi:hypothetical protein